MNPEARRRLEDLLDREIDAARLLASILAAERTALTGTSTEAVQTMAAEKVQLLRNIEKLEDERRALGATAGQALPAWRTLLELMAGCRAANEVNGYIINLRRGQIKQLIDIVRGGAPVTYGPQGKTFAKALRALARA
jgi:flagellar biosynthesis/type III secretory pathway chaperone